MPRTLILYTGDGCHLCDQARDLILSQLPEGWRLREIDIRGDDELRRRHGHRIPVVAVESDGEGGGKRVSEKAWPFTPGQLRRLMQAGD